MKRAASPLLVLAAGLLLTTCSRDDAREGGSDPTVTAALMRLYARGDFFELRDRLDTLAALRGPEPAFLRAVVANAFNDPDGSNRALAPLGEAVTLPDSLRAEVYRLRFRNHMRLGEYRAALDASELLENLPAADSAVRNDVENEARAAAALVDVPPQRIVSRASSEIRRRPDTRVPVQVGDSAGRGYVLDTGANLSTLMRSEAESLGLRIREAGVEVGTSTGTTVTADVAVAPHVRLGDVVLENVVFLVVPDEVLTFGPTFRIEGIIGFPVIDALGEVQFHAGGVLRIPGDVPRRTPQNLALDYLTPLIEVGVLGHPAICDLDTGANRTSLHEPFYRRHRAAVEQAGRPDTIRTAGAGGERAIPAWVIRNLRIALGDTATTLPRVAVYTESVAPPGTQRATDCRLGLDLLAGFDGYLLNFRSMSFQPL